MAGLPGTGLGGIFYIFLVLWMIIRKLLKPSRYVRWKQVTPLAGMAVAIILVLWAETWGIAKLVGRLPTFAELVGSGSPLSSAVAILLALLPVVTLGMLVSALHTARLFLPREGQGSRETNRPKLCN
jgi:hypothetical protein